MFQLQFVIGELVFSCCRNIGDVSLKLQPIWGSGVVVFEVDDSVVRVVSGFGLVVVLVVVVVVAGFNVVVAVVCVRVVVVVVVVAVDEDFFYILKSKRTL